MLVQVWCQNRISIILWEFYFGNEFAKQMYNCVIPNQQQLPSLVLEFYQGFLGGFIHNRK